MVPVIIPTARPQTIPGRVPSLTPNARPQAVPVIVPFANPTPGTARPVNELPHPAAVTVPSQLARPPSTTSAPVRPPQPTPQAVPVLVPQSVPQAIPGRVPTLQGTSAPAVLAQVNRPKPRPQNVPSLQTSQAATSHHRPTVQAPAIGHQMVTRQPGRQPKHDAPRFQEHSGKVIRCIASGHGKRRTVVDGEVETTGALRHVGSVDVLGRDLPALHPRHSGCIIAIKRRKD